MQPGDKHDDSYQRPITARYLDPCEVIWLATAHRLGMHIRRSPWVFSATDGTGLLELSTRSELDADDTVAQMLLHEICHWVTNGEQTFHKRDWGYELDAPTDWREHSALRLQAWLADQVGLRSMFGPTGLYRQYYDRIPADPLAPLDSSSWEDTVVVEARRAVQQVQQPPWHPHVLQALQATRKIRDIVTPFLSDYTTEINADTLPSLWHAADE